MPSWFGTTEIIIILVIVLVLFGGGRVGKIARELGGGIKSFRQGMAEVDQADDNKKE